MARPYLIAGLGWLLTVGSLGCGEDPPGSGNGTGGLPGSGIRGSGH